MKRRKPNTGGRKKVKAPPSLAPTIVDVVNPWFSPQHPEGPGNKRMIPVAINPKESAVETLFQRRLLSAIEKLAADTFRAKWELYAQENVRAVDYGREHVDGGSVRGPVTEAQLAARADLQRARVMLGQRGFDLVRDICGKGKSLKDIGRTNRERTTLADNLRLHLDDLGRLWGLQGKRTGSAKKWKSGPSEGKQ